MTAGPFMMTNLEGLFSPFKHFDEMDDLRSMRREMWNEMERREQGAWTMFGRFFDRHMEEVNRMRSNVWDSGFFSPTRNRAFGSPFRGQVNNEESNVIVEFPDDKEIKITLEEPLVVITEVDDEPETTRDSPTEDHHASSPVGKSSPIIHDEDGNLNAESDSHHVTSMSKSKTETVHSEANAKTEKKTKRVDFSKMEVHFEPGSGRVNIVETNEKPPSNQLFRKKRRHRSRLDTSKINFVGSTHQGSFENLDTNPGDRLEPPLNTNINISQLQNNLDLSIFNLRKTLFKNSVSDYTSTQSNRVQTNDEIKTTLPKIASDKKVPAKSSNLRTSFHVSSKLQNMIQNSVSNQIKLVESPGKRIKEINIEKEDNMTNARYEKGSQEHGKSHSTVVASKPWNSSLKRNNSRGKDITVVVNNHPDSKPGTKQVQLNGERVNNRLKTVSRSDSLKKNSKVSRQESIKSNSSRGSISSENRLCHKKNNLKDSTKRECGTRIHRTPSIGKITSNSLKKGGIYVDGRPKKTKGSTVTLISYSSNNMLSNRNTSSNDRTNTSIYQNSKNRIVNESPKSFCSSESLISSKVAQNKKDALKDFSRERIIPVDSSRKSSSEYARLNFTKKSDSSDFKMALYNNIPVVKQDSCNADTTKCKVDNILSSTRTSLRSSDFIGRCKNLNYVNVAKDTSKDGMKFHHRDSSLFQPIKKEKSIHSDNSLSEIKTPIAIRKRLNSQPRRQSKDKTEDKKISVERSNAEFLATKVPSKFHLSLRRSKEPLRSFEKISNGWVKCNISGRSANSSHLSAVGNAQRDLTSPSSQTSRISGSHQREAMIRLSKGIPSRIDSATYSNRMTETRKRSRNSRASSISSQSSVQMNKRRPSQEQGRTLRPETPDNIYETLNSRRQPQSFALGKRNRQTNHCCNI